MPLMGPGRTLPDRDCCSSSSVMVEKLVSRCEVISGLAAPNIRRRFPFPFPVSSCCSKLLCWCCCWCVCCSCCCDLASFSAAVKTTIGLGWTGGTRCFKGGGQVSILGSGTTHSPNTYRGRRVRLSQLRSLGAEGLVLRDDAQQTVELKGQVMS